MGAVTENKKGKLLGEVAREGLSEEVSFGWRPTRRRDGKGTPGEGTAWSNSGLEAHELYFLCIFCSASKRCPDLLTTWHMSDGAGV